MRAAGADEPELCLLCAVDVDDNDGHIGSAVSVDVNVFAVGELQVECLGCALDGHGQGCQPDFVNDK